MKTSIAVECPVQKAEKARLFLKQENLLNPNLKPFSRKGKLFFALKKLPQKNQLAKLKKLLPKAKIVSKRFSEQVRQPRSLKEALKGRLSAAEMKHLVSSFDTVGSIAIIEIPKQLEKKQKLIGWALLETNKSIKTVCKISSEHKGEFRVQDVKVIAGKKTTAALYKEHGCSFRVDVAKVFFSPRLSTERIRISRLIKKGEVVGAFFAGVGPFPIVFAKNSKMEKAIAIELNPVAFKLMKQNIVLNKVEKKVEPILGDVKKVAPKKLKGKCDRVVMPLPRGAGAFLGSAFKALAVKGGVIHFYQFEPKDKPFNAPLKRIKETAKKSGRKVKVLRKAIVRSFSPKTVQVVIDFKAF